MTGIFGICADRSGGTRKPGDNEAARQFQASLDRRETQTCSPPIRAAPRYRDATGLGILIALPPAIVVGIRIQNDSGSAMLLRDEDFHSAEVFAVAHEHDFAADIDLHLLQFSKSSAVP